MATKLTMEIKDAPSNGNTYLPMDFWSQMVQTMDTKSRSLSEVYGFGKITMTFVFFNGKVKDVVFNDEVRLRPDWEKPPTAPQKT